MPRSEATETMTVRQRVMARDQSRCRYCDAPADTVDHVLPKSRQGPHSMANLVAACQPCNQRKRDRTPEEAGMPLLPVPPAPRWHEAAVVGPW